MDDTRIPIEELVKFPTKYTFKAIGHHKLTFTGRVLEAVRKVLGEDRKIELRTRLSSKGAYVSVTLVARVENADELRGVYAALRTVSEVITVL
ncbi:MAG: DUF493 domain-containing protein [Deltaproteobacteria bacterium]|nr:DUF493 domain-containing protein [Deltaproteobacteria bacterium]